MQRTHTCGEITAKNNNKTVELAGWTHAVRLHGGLVFVDIRDRYGLTQLVFDSSENKENYNIAQKLNKEDIIKIKGKVRPRKKGFENSKLKTGEIEVLVNKLEILSKSSPLPIDIEEDEVHANEDTRIKYRYLDLRRPSMRNNLITRHKVIKATRDYLDKLNFIEI